MQIFISNQISEAVFDSGANVSTINHEFLNQLGQYKIEKVNTIIKSANEICKCLGRVQLKISIGNVTQSVYLYVIKNLNQNILIGLDLIDKFQLNLSSKLQVSQIKDNQQVEIQTNYQKLSESKMQINLTNKYFPELPKFTNQVSNEEPN